MSDSPTLRPRAEDSRDPDLRAIFRPPRHFRVVDWGTHVASPAADSPAGAVVFDLWERGDQLLARQHGASEAGPEIRRLGRWASARGRCLELGAPLGPRRIAAGRRVPLPSAPAPGPPTFTFVYPEPDARPRLRITPWGFAEAGLDRLRAPWRGAVGEVWAADDDRAVVRFARLDAEHRSGALRALERWACEDGWQLSIDERLRPLSAPDPEPSIHPGSSCCPGCASVWGTGVASHLAFGLRGWRPTRCLRCGGRERWWGPGTAVA